MTLQSIQYTFDNVGNVSTMGVSTTPTPGTTYNVNHSFVYDQLNRLKTATATCANDTARRYNQGYNYDLAGNMISKTGIGAFEVTEWDTDGPYRPRLRPETVEYDTMMTGIGERDITYNQENKPTAITFNGGTTTYLTYDGAGNRIKKVKGTETVIYVGDMYEIRNGHATCHIFANGKKIASMVPGNTYYTHSDKLGSASIVTNQTGTVVEEMGYLPFGATLFKNNANGSTWESVYRFTGQEFDEESQLYNYNARLYDPIMCRFISPDSIVPNPYNPQSLNRYAYVLNNPLRYSDPSGHVPECTLPEIVISAKRIELMDFIPENAIWNENNGDMPPWVERIMIEFQMHAARAFQSSGGGGTASLYTGATGTSCSGTKNEESEIARLQTQGEETLKKLLKYDEIAELQCGYGKNFIIEVKNHVKGTSEFINGKIIIHAPQLKMGYRYNPGRPMELGDPNYGLHRMTMERLIVHEAFHSRYPGSNNERTVIRKTNDFMEKYFNEPRNIYEDPNIPFP